MTRLAIALDLGTSGFRGQAIDLDQGGLILSTAVTTRHPSPGANVIDHLHFALELGLDLAHDVVIQTINQLLENLGIDKQNIVRLAVCGNPIQLSIFQEIEIRDLAYAGQRKLQALGVEPPERNAQIVKAKDIRGLHVQPEVDVLIPPAVRHEIGADALAMMIQTGMLDKEEISLVTDYGTNAEMALKVGDTVYTGSTAAGPALEGQQIEDGLLALPGAISDVDFSSMQDIPGHRSQGSHLMRSKCLGAEWMLNTWVLDTDMNPQPGDSVDPTSGQVISQGQQKAVGITGTGVVALINQCLLARLMHIPKINTADRVIHLPDSLRFTEHDLLEAGKAIGSVRAGHITLCQEAGIHMDQIQTAYMSGASGTYVNALKAQELGMIPATVKTIHQVGNTSLAMARDMANDPEAMWQMKAIAEELRQHHCMFASSKTFEKVYILELAYWTEGMPFQQYLKFLKKYKIPEFQDQVEITPKVIKKFQKDIPELGVQGLSIIHNIGTKKRTVFEGCLEDGACIQECPENALQMDCTDSPCSIEIDLSLCDGVACRRCERVCSEHVFNLTDLLTSA